MKRPAYLVAQEIAVRELGWQKIGSWWVNPELPRPRFLELSEVLLHEWKEAAARAGRADHLRDQLRFRINLLIVLLTASLLVSTFLLRLLSV